MIQLWRGGPVVLLAAIACGCDYVPGYYTYRAEVGYYQNGQQAWYVGSDKSYDACISEARNYFASLNTSANPNRAFSWACRKMHGEEFLDRVR
jgi:hypothetical protein